MATIEYYFSGMAKWVMASKLDPKYGTYKMNLYVDKETKKAIKQTGIKSQFNEDEDGEFITFRRKPNIEIKGKQINLGQPKLFNKEGKPFEGLIGNGSKVTVKVQVYDSANGKASRWESLRVEELVPYEGSGVEQGNTPAEGLPF